MSEMDRRRFLLSTAGTVLLGCAGKTARSSTGSPCASGSDGGGLGYCLVERSKLTVPGAHQLTVGEATIMAIDDQSAAIVARDDQGHYALSATCTHACCTVTLCAGQACDSPVVSENDCALPKKGLLPSRGAAFLCPCHGSQFTADGSVFLGPARVPLPAVALEFVGDDAIVDLATPVPTSIRVRGTTACSG